MVWLFDRLGCSDGRLQEGCSYKTEGAIACVGLHTLYCPWVDHDASSATADKVR